MPNIAHLFQVDEAKPLRTIQEVLEDLRAEANETTDLIIHAVCRKNEIEEQRRELLQVAMITDPELHERLKEI